MFCQIISGEVPGHLVLETDDLVAFLDTRPVFKGHVLLVPRTHLETLPDLPAGQRDGFLAAAQRLATAVKDALGAQGSFVAINNTVSQSVPHLHLHVVPRTKGDGLRGFFWPRTKYGDGEAAAYAERLRVAPRRPAEPVRSGPAPPRGARASRERPRSSRRRSGWPVVLAASTRASGADDDPAEHVHEEVPPQVDRRQAGQRGEDPAGQAHPPGEPDQLRDQARGDRDGDVQRREGGDGLHRAGVPGVGQHGHAVVEQQLLDRRC